MNTAQVIPFKKPSQPNQKAGTMYSDKFENGYVMSSRLYRKEVRPFLSDAARNVYSELEDHINGHLKQTDHVSHRQIQGGDLKGSNKLGSATVSAGLKELIWFGVITLVEKSNKYGNKYQINDISLVHYFEEVSASVIKALRISNKSTSIREALQLVKRKRTSNESGSASPSDASIDNKNSLDIKKKKLPVDNSGTDIFSNSVEYHVENKNLYSLRELSKKYSVQSDFTAQAKVDNSDLSSEQILTELKEFAQWSVAQEKRTAQAWMNNWIYRLQKLKALKGKSKSTNTPSKPKALSDSQIDYFASKLCNFDEFASMYANVGETQKSFESRIAAKLRDPKSLREFASYLRDVGFAGNFEDFA